MLDHSHAQAPILHKRAALWLSCSRRRSRGWKCINQSEIEYLKSVIISSYLPHHRNTFYIPIVSLRMEAGNCQLQRKKPSVVCLKGSMKTENVTTRCTTVMRSAGNIRILLYCKLLYGTARVLITTACLELHVTRFVPFLYKNHFLMFFFYWVYFLCQCLEPTCECPDISRSESHSPTFTPPPLFNDLEWSKTGMMWWKFDGQAWILNYLHIMMCKKSAVTNLAQIVKSTSVNLVWINLCRWDRMCSWVPQPLHYWGTQENLSVCT